MIIKSWVILLFTIALLIATISCAPQTHLRKTLPFLEPKDTLPYKIDEKFSYEVKFNGIKVGKIDFEYQGRKGIDRVYHDIVVINSNVNILRLFQIKSKELIYVNAANFLPQKVEREVKFLGKEESILEEYNQKEGWVKVTLKKGQTIQERLIYQNPPIQNSLNLFFLYPLNLQERLGEVLEFNLPLQKIKIKIKELRKIQTLEGIDEVYLLEVSNHRKSLVWIKKQARLPMRLELPAFLGRVVITKK